LLDALLPPQAQGRSHKSGSHWRQPFAPDAAAVAQNGAPALRRVPAQKAVLTFAANFRWLILAFHKALPLRGVRCGASLPEKRATLSVKAGVSTLRVNSNSQKSNFKAPELRTSIAAQIGSFGIWSLVLGICRFQPPQFHTCKDNFVV
jgi:hypothetical protein